MNTINENTNPAEHEVQHLIEIHGIGKDYQDGENSVQAIKQMDFHIDDGEFVAIMGQSGSGKSTLLNLIAGLDKPTSGHVYVCGQDLGSTSQGALAQTCSQVRP